ncbi:MAG: hypothetical protein RIN55_07780 [Tissierellaceae bacterium]|nr:hypothetical protein [Tissierellaceae bacterium]
MKFLVLLSGCGLGDGSQIEEVILTYLVLDKYNIEYQPIALDIECPSINHLTEDQDAQRNVLVESARMGRGKIKNLLDINTNDYNGLIIPGGIGLINNYSSHKLIQRLIEEYVKDKKPMLGMCSALSLLRTIVSPDLLNNERETEASDYCYDEMYNIYYTPAFRRSQSLYEISMGIDAMILKVISI